MTLIYIDAASFKNGVIVCIEAIGKNLNNIVYYSFSRQGYVLNKLIALQDYLEKNNFGIDEDLTIFLDSDEMVEAYRNIKFERKKSSAIRYEKEWKKIIKLLLRYRYIPEIRNKGILSQCVKDDLKLYVKNIEGDMK